MPKSGRSKNKAAGGQCNIQAVSQELRQRKEEALRNISNGNSYQEGPWQRYVSKRGAKRDHKFWSREERLRRATSFYVSNLPDGCTTQKLWESFQHFENLEDAFVPFKKDGAGNKFVFLRFSEVGCPVSWADNLKDSKVGDAIVEVKPSKFNRDGSKASSPSVREKESVFNRLSVPECHGQTKTGVSLASNDKRRSYSSVVGGSGDSLSSHVVALPPLNTAARKSWVFKSLIGEAKEMNYLERLEECMEDLNIEDAEVRYVGGLKVMFTFPSSDVASFFLENEKEKWSVWFSNLEVWDGSFNHTQRIAWVRVIGVPVCLWDRHVLNRIGERCGRILLGSDASTTDSDLSSGKLAVLVNTGERVCSEFLLSSGGQSIKVWVNEYENLWAPSMPEPRPEKVSCASPVMKSKVVVPDKVGGEDESVGVCSPTNVAWGNEKEGEQSCMGSMHGSGHVSPDGLGGAFSADPNKEGDPLDDSLDSTCGPDVVVNTPVGLSGESPSFYQDPPRLFSKLKSIICTNEPTSVAPSADSDPFNLDEVILKDAEEHNRNKSSRAMGAGVEVDEESGDEDGDDSDEEVLFEREVGETMDYGYCLGIDMNGFDNQVRKLVKGERVTTSDK
ncbi:putative RNA recognition motif domain, nucleotide-binding alpha-beta plait domain superfamily [Helianthus annuus]|nr:putative RNA recognition motif domain, nucleotide-binding alpha-beta plait domain superfamily [Helianthus annuus]